ncbi:DUF1576 domain-containing protein [Alkalibacterium olivapovliticus]|uniref:Uncharacterized protein DUF1576 n=1 Tax=Alkalibacterium olivapovliticus TaxID=99907 RepID=A0A2T0WB03_9LACT|nr:DUF1576 domain-containing protein [Alkalibacterium olivapovliticus]PRY83890.1 uncharacterized protein DUF1576 [Alkalibacterium olivapovliticus]
MISENQLYITQHDVISQNVKYGFLLSIALLFASLAFVFNTPLEIYSGMITILTSPANLTTDYFALANVGATLCNSALLTVHSIGVIRMTRAKVNGPIIAAVFTVAAFSFFGKNLYNSMPIVIGAFAYARVTEVPAEKSLLAALFGTALGPLVSEITFNIGLPFPLGIFYGYLFGFIAGFVIPPLAKHFVGFTKGFSVYNVGFTCGVVGTMFTSLLRSTGRNIEPVSVISSGNNQAFTIIFLSLFTFMLISGLYLNSWTLNGYSALLKHSGQLSTDFLKTNGFSVTLINMALLGYISTLYVLFHGGELNGPSIGGILTVVGFGAFGKHIRNVLPILIGVTLMGFLNDYDMSATSVVIAGLFGTTIAPIAGRYGTLIGILAGALHLSVVSNTGYLHGGINLYNNGFAGGFVAAIMIPLLEAVQYQQEKRKQLREPVDPAEEIKVSK